MFKVVNYVKSRYVGDTSLFEALKKYLSVVGHTYADTWTCDFYLYRMIIDKEIHVCNQNGDEILEQYLVTVEDYNFEEGEYYEQIEF